MSRKVSPKKERKVWLQLIRSQLERFRTACFEVDGKTYVSSKYRLDEPFVWRLLVAAGALTRFALMSERAGGIRLDEKDLNRRRQELEVLEQAALNYYPALAGHKPRLAADPQINLRSIWVLDRELVDEISRWSYWTEEDGGSLVAEVTILSQARAYRALRLTNSTREPDARWDALDEPSPD